MLVHAGSADAPDKSTGLELFVVPLTQLAAYIANVFNIQLDTNLSRTFCDMKLRNNPTPWIDKAKQALLQRMRTWRPKNKK